MKEASPWNSCISRLKAKLGVKNVTSPAHAHNCLSARILKHLDRVYNIVNYYYYNLYNNYLMRLLIIDES